MIVANLRPRPPSFAIAVFLALVAAGCGRGVSGYCEDAATCEFGNEADVEACVLRFEETEELAALYNCDDEFSDWFDCLDEQSDCDDERYRPANDRCENVEERLERCIDDD